MNQLTTYQKKQLGKAISTVLGLKRDKKIPERFVTDWGTKTDLGIGEIVLRLIEEIKEG